MKSFQRNARKIINFSQEQLVKSEPFYKDASLPLLIQPVVDGVELTDWIDNNHQFLTKQLADYGAILFRNFAIQSPEAFNNVVKTVSPETLEYKERSSPRSQVTDNIYTSTDYPADQSIFLHNENSYANTWPLKIFFYCQTPAQKGGETPLADSRRILQRISPAIQNRFRQKQVMYVRNLGQDVGLSWETVFQTSDRSAVEDYCKKSGYEIEWIGEKRLRTRRVAPVIVAHPLTGEQVWFNHAAFFHVSTLPEVVRNTLLAQYRREDLPNNTYYGDGSPIEPDVLDELRAAYHAETITFPWQQGDIALLDNMLVAHARSPFQGPRRVLVAMSEAFSSRKEIE